MEMRRHIANCNEAMIFSENIPIHNRLHEAIVYRPSIPNQSAQFAFALCREFEDHAIACIESIDSEWARTISLEGKDYCHAPLNDPQLVREMLDDTSLAAPLAGFILSPTHAEPVLRVENIKGFFVPAHDHDALLCLKL